MVPDFIEGTIKFPGVGHVYEADFGQTIIGEFAVQLDFESETKMTFIVTKGSYKGMRETGDINAVELRPGLYMVKWQEKTKASVVHIEDFENGIVYANITLMDGTFMQWKGTWKRIR